MKYSLVAFFVALAHTFYAQVKADDILGIWLTTGKEPAKIEIYKSGEKYFGKIVWLKNPINDNGPRVDVNNPDKKKRNRPIIGLTILTDFRFEKNDWDGGKIYDPESGNTYKCYLTLEDNTTLNVRGYIGISLFGRTETWKRTK